MNEDQSKAAEQSVTRMRECCRALQTQMGSVLIGQGDVVRLLLTGLMSGGHMLVIGVPGLAKTMMVKALADLLGWEFRRIQFTPDLMPADITGTNVAAPFKTWSILGPALETPSGSGQYQFTDSPATNNAAQFYRVRSP